MHIGISINVILTSISLESPFQVDLKYGINHAANDVWESSEGGHGQANNSYAVPNVVYQVDKVSHGSKYGYDQGGVQYADVWPEFDKGGRGVFSEQRQDWRWESVEIYTQIRLELIDKGKAECEETEDPGDPA